MDATVVGAREGAANLGTQARIALKDTRYILTKVIVPIYAAGLILPLPIGWLGELLNLTFVAGAWLLRQMTMNGAADAVLSFGNWLGLDHLGNVPALIAFVLVSCFYWAVELRLMTAEGVFQLLPDFIQKRILSQSTDKGFTGKVFWVLSTIGLWGPLLLWVPSEFPVWRYPFHYVGALAGFMSITFFVGSTRDWNKPIWRKVYGAMLVAFIVRHLLGFIGISIPVMIGSVSGLNLNDGQFDPMDLLFLAGALAIIAIGISKPKSPVAAK